MSIAVHAPRLTVIVSTGLSSPSEISSPKTRTRFVPVVAANRIPPSWTSVAVRMRDIERSARRGRELGRVALGLCAAGSLELLVVQPRVEPALGEQLGVGATLDDPAALVDQDLVGSQDRREAMGDRD